MFGIFVDFSLLVVSLASLVFIADKLIDHSVKFAKIVGVSGAVIGLTLLAYGTSVPEFAVSSIASYGTHDQLSVSNIIGSNIYNIAMVLGIAAIILPFSWKDDFRRDGIFMIFATLVLIPLAFIGGISPLSGLMMVFLLAIYSYYVIRKDKKVDSDGNAIKKESGSVKKEFAFCLILLLGVLVAGYFTVEFAVETARGFGISEWIIGATIVAAGTSMPETVVSIISAKKKQMGMSLGNIIGSNYFNVLWILGASAIISPLSFHIQDIWIDLLFLFILTGLFFLAVLRKKITRIYGFIYIGIYIIFVLHILGFLGF
ncbi:MAG: calcium/sodium antiporter [Candidatus Aenigmatarchaeota archaeon]